MSNNAEEQVFAFPANEVTLPHSGIYLLNEDTDIFKRGSIHKRSDIKRDPNWRQPIEYSVLVNTEDCVLVYQRTPKGGEGRLHGNLSIGFGGHVNPIDFGYEKTLPTVPFEINDPDLIRQAIVQSGKREILEELGMESSFTLGSLLSRPVIIDNTNEVGRCHVGFLRIKRSWWSGVEIITCSDDIKLIGYFPLSELTDRHLRTEFEKEHGAVFENWSQMTLNYMHGK